MIIQKYSEKSVKISGDDTKEIKEILKKYGCKWNPNLEGGKGWILASVNLTKLIEGLGKDLDREIDVPDIKNINAGNEFELIL